MWLLTCDGDLFEGKRLWLRPGSTHLLGRTSSSSEAGERRRYIQHKTVSRKHLTIVVGAVKPGDGSRIHTRSEIKITDGSKAGTTVNGEKIVQATKTLNEKEYTIKLGHYEPLFHLWWHTVTVSYTSSSKRSKGDPLAIQREKLEQADIKLISEYVSNETTHAIVRKRNTPPALQALLQARWLVTEEYVEALASAVEKTGSDETSPLEDDFDGNWPKEENFFVPAGTEPQPRANEYLRPDPERAEVFQDYAFIFLSQTQFDTLLPVITSGGGKALLYEVELGQSKVEDVVEYVKEVAGHKNSGQFRLSQQGGRGGVVVIRLNERDEGLRDFVRSVDLALDQTSIEQNEFLDAILTVEARGLRRSPPEVPDSPSAAASAKHASQPQSQQPTEQRRAVTVPDSPQPAEEAPTSAQPEPEEPPQEPQSTAAKRRNRRIITQSRFKGFDDFDPSQFSKPASQSPEPSFDQPEPSQAASVQSMEVNDEPESSRTQQNTRKRPARVDDEKTAEENMYASILTGHAAMKRQKTAAAQNDTNGASAKSSAAPATEKGHKSKKKQKEMDVMGEIQARRQREDEERRKDEEALREQLQGVDIKDLKDLAKVEEMEVPARERLNRNASQNRNSDRWDAAWNGRKNFKKFRTKGQNPDGPRLRRVIVTLEEVPKKGHGIGDEYWLNTTVTNNNKNNSKSKSQSQSQSVRAGASRSQRLDGDEEDATRFRRRLQSSREEDQEYAVAEDVVPEDIAGQARDENLEAATNVNSTPSQTFGTESQRKAAGKRPAAQQAGGPAKKAKQSRLATSREIVNLENDDDDDLKFRRRRR